MDDEAAMELALTEAAAALGHGDVPVGAVVLHDGVPIAQRHNEREHLQDHRSPRGGRSTGDEG